MKLKNPNIKYRSTLGKGKTFKALNFAWGYGEQRKINGSFNTSWQNVNA
jgi:hypothetical protein